MTILENQKKDLRTNEKAAKIMATYANHLYSYLNAKPDKEKKYNHIYAVPSDERNENNGLANFKLIANEYRSNDLASCKTYYLRLETDFFQDKLTIPIAKTYYLKKANILMFANKDECFISTNNEWLTDKNYFYVSEEFKGTTSKVYCHYNILSLAAHGYVTKLIKENNKLILVNDGSFICEDLNKKATSSSRTIKPFHDYGINVLDFKYVQYDLKIPQAIYWNYAIYNYTTNLASITALSAALATKTSWNAKSIYQKIRRAYNQNIKDGKTHIVRIPANRETIKKALTLECDNILDEKCNLCIVVSNSPDFDIQNNIEINKTENMKDYQKDYQKDNSDMLKMHKRVATYLKRNNGKFNPKWTKEEIEYADSIL